MHKVCIKLIEYDFFIILKVLTPFSVSLLDQLGAAYAHADAVSR